MGVALRLPDSERHPFGGCDKLLSQYQLVGAALCDVEQDFGVWRSLLDPLTSSVTLMGAGVSFSKITVTKFREDVVTVSVEVLESYLDDLLNLDTDESELFIKKKYPYLVPSCVALLGLVFAVSFGMYSLAHGAKFQLGLLLTVFAAFPFALVWHFAPRERVVRRMRFAKLLAVEISRRRGDSGRATRSRDWRYSELQASGRRVRQLGVS